jgi:16S rRNA processing protein RimM
MSLVLARIGKPHGLRGEVTVRLHTDEPEARFAVGAVLDTEAEPGSGVPKALTIASTRVHNGVWLLTFEEIPDRTGAEGLRGTKLVTADSAAATDDEEAYYEEDLVGLEIGAAQDRLVLRLTDGVTAYVPFMRHMVPVVAEDHVVVDPPAGLFDLYREGTE